jgi:enoyl-[acyl-carrier protein] reductase II
MLSCTDSPVHQNWKQAIYDGKETDTVFLNQQGRPALRAMRTERTGELELLGQFQPFEHMANILDLYFGGDLEAAIPLTGQVMGRINESRSAVEVVRSTMDGFHACLEGLKASYS